MSVNVKKNGKIIKVAGAVDLSILNYIAQAKAETEASASAAATSAQSAETDASLSKSYAVGTGGEVRPDDATENAKRYWEQTKEISESFAGTLRPKGTIAFSELPSVSTAEPGDMYNISDEFVTTSDFKEGAGLTIPLGSNIYLTVSRKWDVLAGSPVTSVNGMRGNVNITPNGIGALPTEGGTLTGMLTPDGGISSAGKDGIIVYPEDGNLAVTESKITGYLKIKLPVTYTGNMVRFVVSIYNYVDGESSDYYISGFTGSSSLKWVSTTSVCVGAAGKEKANLSVRFGHDSGKCAITIGDENEEWDFLKVRIHDIIIWNPSDFNTWKSGWGISVDSNPLEKVDTVITNTNITMLETDSSDYHAIHHRNTFRGRNLGTSFTAAQKAAIRNNTFEGLYVGDYWVINGITWRIVDINYWLGTGDVNCTTPHLVLMPDTILYNAPMNDTNTTAGGYVGSKMYKEGLENAKSMINSAFGSAYILNHREYLTNVVADGSPSAGSWYDSKVELPTEIMIYGNRIFAPDRNNISNSYVVHNFTIDKTQLALMKLYPKFINPNRQDQRLRDVISSGGFGRIDTSGLASYSDANVARGVRPVFGLTGGAA